MGGLRHYRWSTAELLVLRSDRRQDQNVGLCRSPGQSIGLGLETKISVLANLEAKISVLVSVLVSRVRTRSISRSQEFGFGLDGFMSFNHHCSVDV